MAVGVWSRWCVDGLNRIGEVVELDNIIRVPAVEAEAGLAVVGGGADEVDGDVVGGDEAGEVEELVEMALGDKGHHNNHHI